MTISVQGSHSRGPLLGDNKALGGLLEDIPLGAADQVRSPYKTWVENFSQLLASGELAGIGGTVTTVGAVAGNNETVSAGKGLTLNAGTAASTGYNVQINAALSSTTLTPIVFPSPISFGTAANNNRELVWFCRFGISSNAVTWDGAALVGLYVTDTSLTDASGNLTVASTGGAGVHISTAGVISTAYGTGAITAPVATVGAVGATTASATTFKWYDFGLRHKQLTTTTGRLRLYFGTTGNIQQVLDAAQALSGTLTPSFVILNGAANQSDLVIDSMFTALTRGSNFADNLG